jgi:hypothetical protein
MVDAGCDDWQCGELVLVPLSWRDEELWSQIQANTQGHIGTNLRSMYSELLQQPLSPALLDIARQIERQLNAP